MNETVLVVDDSETVRKQLSGVLREAGYAILSAANAPDGLSQADENDVDLIIVDVNMPGMSGIEMIRKLREHPKYSEVPVFVLTTESSSQVAKQGKEAGATAWIVKPFKPPILLRGIQAVLGKVGT